MRTNQVFAVAILMTLEGEYYSIHAVFGTAAKRVAILMTLEGEYYSQRRHKNAFLKGRNPHDIGRRILQKTSKMTLPRSFVAILMTLEGEYYNRTCADLQERKIVAILMTLEGEYY